MTRHKWSDTDICIHCGIARELKTRKLHMAMVGNRDYYQYETKMAYLVNGKWTFVRPECVAPKKENGKI